MALLENRIIPAELSDYTSNQYVQMYIRQLRMSFIWKSKFSIMEPQIVDAQLIFSSSFNYLWVPNVCFSPWVILKCVACSYTFSGDMVREKNFSVSQQHHFSLPVTMLHHIALFQWFVLRWLRSHHPILLGYFFSWRYLRPSFWSHSPDLAP